jgi:hypothetical protein
MQRADKNNDELLEDLTRRYHRLRQNGIDEELFEIISGFETLSAGEIMMRMGIATDQRGLGLSLRNADALSECKRNRCRVSLNRKVPNEAGAPLRATHRQRPEVGDAVSSATVNGVESALFEFLSPNAGAPDADETSWSATCPSVGLWAWARHNEKACAAGVLSHFILSFILRHWPIFDVSDFPMLLGFRFSTDRTIDSISVSFYHFLWDF